MRRPDEMHDRIGPVYGRCERRCVERVADDCGYVCGRTAQRLGAHECTDVMATRNQRGDQSATDVAGAARYKYLLLNGRGYYFELIDFPLRCPLGGTMAGIESSHLLLVSTC